MRTDYTFCVTGVSRFYPYRIGKSAKCKIKRTSDERAGYSRKFCSVLSCFVNHDLSSAERHLPQGILWTADFRLIRYCLSHCRGCPKMHVYVALKPYHWFPIVIIQSLIIGNRRHFAMKISACRLCGYCCPGFVGGYCNVESFCLQGLSVSFACSNDAKTGTGFQYLILLANQEFFNRLRSFRFRL